MPDRVQEELAQTERAISSQTGGEGERMAQLALMRMELEGEVKELEAQLEAKKGALREVWCLVRVKNEPSGIFSLNLIGRRSNVDHFVVPCEILPCARV